MSTELPTLGRLLPEGEGRRDAVHVAIAPVTAGMSLRPGDHFTLAADGTAIAAPPGKGIGYVDPELLDVVRKGQRFWGCLYHGTVTSLRHIWTHPAFTPRVPGGDQS
jgi:hypothetical protein